MTTVGRRLVVRVEAFTGPEYAVYQTALEAGTPEALVAVAEHCARLCLKPGNPFHGMDPDDCILVLELPFGTYRITHVEGAVVPYDQIAGV